MNVRNESQIINSSFWRSQKYLFEILFVGRPKLIICSQKIHYYSPKLIYYILKINLLRIKTTVFSSPGKI